MENEMVKPIYQEKFDAFINNCEAGQIDGEIVGLLIVRLAQEFVNHNMMIANKEARLNSIAAKMIQETDEISGKPYSVSKVELLVKNSEEYKDLKIAKIDLENIETYINSLKFLQKAILQEYAQTGGI